MSSSTAPVIHLTTRLARELNDNPHDFHYASEWWTTSGGSTFLPTGSEPPSDTPQPYSPSVTPFPIPPSNTAIPVPITSSASGVISGGSPMPSQFPSQSSSATNSDPQGSIVLTTFTSSVPVTVTQPSSTFLSYSQTTIVSTQSGTALPASETLSGNIQNAPVCIGDGVDAQSLGLVATAIVPSVLGLILWLIFAIVRPRYRQVYSLREWFVQQDLRPKPLGKGLFAFLNPHVPLVPSVPPDVSDAGRSSVRDAELFPSDEALSQRTLWICLLMVLGWMILGLAGFLPLYMVNTPCLADSLPTPRYTGAWSVLQDLSLMRLIHLLDEGNFTTVGFTKREIVNGQDLASNVRTRMIILTILAIVLGVLPVLWKIIREFNRLVAYRERWLDVKCQGLEMGWLSAQSAPGFVGWGEKRLKDFVVKSGLSASLESPLEQPSNNGRSRRRRRAQEWNSEERTRFEVDVQSLFSIGDTTHLALLIDERDEILENLEIAETKYITSFKLSTPDPSIVDFYPHGPPTQDDIPPPVPPKPEISRPLPLGATTTTRRRRRGRNPAFGSSSLPPTSYVMPSPYYKLRGVEGVTGGQFTDSEGGDMHMRGPSLTDSISRRVVGSRFQEVNRDSVAFGRIPYGSQIIVEKNGQMGPVSQGTDTPMPEFALYGPNAGHTSWDTAAFNEGLPPHEWFAHRPEDSIPEELSEDWVDVLHEVPEAFQNGEVYQSETSPRRRPRPPRAKKGASVQAPGTRDDRRESFPMRNRDVNEAEEQQPPHLRLQPRQPFVRPLSGMNHDGLGGIYSDINSWRAKLKAINNEISEAQRDCYNDIADGARIKGWLMIGRGLRFVPGVQLIEGRAKEDVRWHELQHIGSSARPFGFWTIVIMISALLAIGMTAVAGLSVATAPEFAHYFPFFLPLSDGNGVATGVAIGLAAAVAAALFISLALGAIQFAGHLSNSVSRSGVQLVIFRTIFWILLVFGVFWLFAAGSILFSFDAFNTDVQDSHAVADGAIYMSAFAMVLIVNVAIIFPALLMLQPLRLIKVLRHERAAVTPRQRFRAVYPRTYNPSYAIGCCVLAVLLASAFSLIFPLVAPAAFLLLLLTLIAHRYLVGYVYGRTHSQTGGLLQIWLLKRFGTILGLQPLLLGLILLSRRLWILGGILCGTAVFVVLFVEIYCSLKTRRPGRRSLSNVTKDSLDTFMRTARPKTPRNVDEESTSLVSSGRETRARGSFASILEMMSVTLAVMPSSSRLRGPIPLETETLDDLTATERAARTHPDAPPHLPPLPFADHAEEMLGILYAPELLAPPPVIWLPNDAGGIGHSEAYDLQKYHDLRVTLDVRASEDVQPRRSMSPQP